MSNTYKLGSMFDGSGGFPLAGSLCGIVPAWASEVEPYPIAVTRSRFPDMKHLGDISKINGAEVEPVDIITFGSPCQDLSVAGKRAGLKHEANGDEETTRSGLFMEAVRIIKEMRRATNGVYPRFALWENVPGAFSSNNGEDFRIVLQKLIQIAEPAAIMPAVPKGGWPYSDNYCGDGWSLAYRVFDAQYWGVPQRRRRIHLIIDLTGECAGDVLFERPGLRGYFAEGRAPGQGTAANAQERTASDDRDGENDCIGFHLLQDPIPNSKVFPCMGQGNSGSGQSSIGVCYETNISPEETDQNILDDQGGNQISIRTDGKAPTLRAEMHGNVPSVMVPIVFDKEVYQSGANATGGHYISEGGPAPTLRSTGHPPGVCVRRIVRRLTPIECARLHGFADRWGDIDRKEDFTDGEYRFWLEVRNTHAAINGKAVKDYTKAQMVTWYNKRHTDSSEYKMWGNGIALPPALYCMQGIVDALEEGSK